MVVCVYPGNNSQEPACVNSGGQGKPSLWPWKEDTLNYTGKRPKQGAHGSWTISFSYGFVPKALSTSGGIFRGQASLAWKPAPSGTPATVRKGSMRWRYWHQEPWAKQAALPEHVTLDTTVVFALPNNQYFNSSLNTGKRRHHLSLFYSTISIL